MPKGTTKRRPVTLARLLDAALEAFAELGFHSASIEDICRRAGYSRGAFYSNFKNRDELFFALFDAHAQRVVDRVAAAAGDIERGNLSVERIAHILAHVDAGERDWYLVTTEFTLYAMRNAEAARALAEHDARIRTTVADLMARLLDQAGRTPKVDLEQLARMAIAMREGALAQSFIDPQRLPPGSSSRTSSNSSCIRSPAKSTNDARRWGQADGLPPVMTRP